MGARLSRRFAWGRIPGCLLYLPLFAIPGGSTKGYDPFLSHAISLGDIVAHDGFEVSSGAQKVLQPLFAADESWTKGTGWSIASDEASHVAGGAGDLEQNISVTAGARYLVEYQATCDDTNGTMDITLGGTAVSLDQFGAANETQHCFVPITATNTGNLKFVASANFAGSVKISRVWPVTHRTPAIGWKFTSAAFDTGVFSGVRITTNTALNALASTFTLVSWLYLTQNAGAGCYIFASAEAAADATRRFGFYISGDYAFSNSHQGIFRQSAAVGDVNVTGATFKGYENGWHCLALTVNSDSVALYLDGAAFGSPTVITALTANTTDWMLGCRGDGSGGYSTPPGGAFGEHAIYNRVLTAAEIKCLYELTRHRYGV